MTLGQQEHDQQPISRRGELSEIPKPSPTLPQGAEPHQDRAGFQDTQQAQAGIMIVLHSPHSQKRLHARCQHSRGSKSVPIMRHNPPDYSQKCSIQQPHGGKRGSRTAHPDPLG